jgi:tetratricopeptide (TPR) repeat protein
VDRPKTILRREKARHGDSESLHSGGIRAAQARYAAIKDDPGYFFDPDELITLVYQLMSVKKFDLAIEVLELNRRVFPDHMDSFLFLAKNHLRKNDRARAVAVLQEALAIAPQNQAVTAMLEKVRDER